MSETGGGDSARTGIAFLVAAPSGTGKTTVCRQVLERDAQLTFSISHTTRQRREGEVDGRDYHFVNEAEFLALVNDDGFLEHAEYAGKLYGTSWRSLQEPLERGQDLLLEIEVQGARQVRDRRPDVRFIFLLPPSLEVLEARLRGRGTDTPAAIAQRLALVDRELEAAEIFDWAVVNDDLDRAVAEVLEIVAAERAGEPARIERFARASVLSAWREQQGR